MDIITNLVVFLCLIASFLYIALAVQKRKEGKKSAWLALGLSFVAIILSVWLILFLE